MRMDWGLGTYVVAREMVDRGLGQHAVVLQLGLAERGGVAGDDDQLGLSGAQALEGGLVAQGDLSGLHHQGEPGVDGVGGILLGWTWLVSGMSS
jgi:hypothetical protein